MANRLLCLLLCLLAVVIALPHTLGLHLTPRAIAPLKGPNLLEKERFLREWIVSADDGSNEQLESLVAYVDCQIYVSYAPTNTSDTVATVRVTGEGDEDLHAIKVSVSASEVQLKEPGIDRIRAEVIVHKEGVLHTITTTRSGQIVVDNHVLPSTDPQANVMLTARDGGDIFLPPDIDLVANTLQLQMTGSGSVHLTGGNIKVTTLSIRSSGAGDLKIAFQSLQAIDLMRVVSTGSSSIDLFASHFHVSTLNIQSSGSGDITLTQDGTTGSQDDASNCQLQATGSGQFHVDSVLCTTVQVAMSGSGNIYTSARELVGCKVSGYGEVSVAMATPVSTMPRGCVLQSPSARTRPPRPAWAVSYTLPPRRMASTDVQVAVSTHDQPYPQPEEKEDKEATASGGIHVSWRALLFLVLVVGGVVVYKRATRAWNRRKQATETTRLLQDDEPVYI